MAAVVAVVIGMDAVATDVCLRLGGAGSSVAGADRFAGVGVVIADSAASASRALLGPMRVAFPTLSSSSMLLLLLLLLLAILCAASSSSNLTQFCLPAVASSIPSKAVSCSGCGTLVVGACCSPLSDMFVNALLFCCFLFDLFLIFLIVLFASVIYAFCIVFFFVFFFTLVS